MIEGLGKHGGASGNPNEQDGATSSDPVGVTESDTITHYEINPDQGLGLGPEGESPVITQGTR